MSLCRRITRNNVQEFISSFDTVLFDCDYVLWNADDPIPGAADTVRKMRKLGKEVLFVTNTGGKSRAEILEKFTSQGHDVSKEELFSTSYVTAIYLKDKLKFEGTVYLIGNEGLAAELDLAGIKYIGVGPDPVFGEEADWLDLELDSEVRAVVVGYDEHFGFMKMFKGASYLAKPEMLFIGTNIDAMVPFPDKGKVRPGAGAFLRAVEAASGRSAITLGKPSHFMFECIQEKYNINPDRALMVGDRHNTDILFGKQCGMKTLAVLTGVLTEEDILQYQGSDQPEEQMYVPDYLLDSIGDLAKLLD